MQIYGQLSLFKIVRFLFPFAISFVMLISCVNAPINIITSVKSGPNVPNGLVAGEPTNIMITLRAPAQSNPILAMNPAYFGYQIPAGGRMEVELGGSFIRNGTDNPATEFVPTDSNETIILGTGLAKNYIVAAKGNGVQHGNYGIQDNTANVIKIVPLGGVKTTGLENARANQIGVKSIYLQPNANGDRTPFTNGSVDSIGTVMVRIFNAQKTVIKTGEYNVKFVSPASVVGPQIMLNNDNFATPLQTSAETVSTELVESTDFQQTEPSSALLSKLPSRPLSTNAPYALQFLMTDSVLKQPDSYAPMMGIPGVGYKINTTDRSKAKLYKDINLDGILDAADPEFGSISITGPVRAKLLALPNAQLTVADDGVTGANGSILRIGAELGFAVGLYKVRVKLNSGAEAVSHIVAR
jgi:hypothetical protein